MSRFPSSGQSDRPRSNIKMRLIIAAAIALFAIVSYYGRPGDVNKITGKSERVAFTEEADEVAMGMQAVPEMTQEFGGPTRNRDEQAMVTQMGRELLDGLDKYVAEKGGQNPYRQAFHFTLLADEETVNAFALPGGQIFITAALFHDLKTEGQLAGVLGHEVGHVIERHSNKRMAKDELFQGLATAGGVAGGDVSSARMAQAIKNMVSMKYGRQDELESDHWGVVLAYYAGYDPRAMIGVMEVLEEASHGNSQPEILSTHPKPGNRVEYIKEVIASEFPKGVPSGLKQ